MCWKEKIQWQSVTNGLRKEHVLRYMIFYAITLCFIMFMCPFVGPLIWTNKILSYLIKKQTNI
jgi:putative Mn2+ efflux pump MntP